MGTRQRCAIVVAITTSMAHRCGGHGAGVSDTETGAPALDPVWQTVIVTSGRIIIGWRAGT